MCHISHTFLVSSIIAETILIKSKKEAKMQKQTYITPCFPKRKEKNTHVWRKNMQAAPESVKISLAKSKIKCCWTKQKKPNRKRCTRVRPPSPPPSFHSLILRRSAHEILSCSPLILHICDLLTFGVCRSNDRCRTRNHQRFFGQLLCIP